MTLIVHHLENSRSQRILWMLEELGLPYEIKRYERDKVTMLAPPELRAVHPLGKSPVLEDTESAGGRVIIERVQSANIWSRGPTASSAHLRTGIRHYCTGSSCITPRVR